MWKFVMTSVGLRWVILVLAIFTLIDGIWLKQDSKSQKWFLIIASIVNIVFSILFIVSGGRI